MKVDRDKLNPKLLEIMEQVHLTKDDVPENLLVILISYTFGEISSNLRAKLKLFNGTTKPLNFYGFIFGESGLGKDVSLNALNSIFIDSFSNRMEKGFEKRVDTTFSSPTEIYFSYEDTIYTVGLHNPDSGKIDTLFINVKDIERYRNDELFRDIYSTDIVNRSEIRTDYLRKKYHLDTTMLYCPLTKNPYIFEVDTTGEEAIFKVISPPFAFKIISPSASTLKFLSISKLISLAAVIFTS